MCCCCVIKLRWEIRQNMSICPNSWRQPATVSIPTSHLCSWKPCRSQEYGPHWMIQMLVLAEFRLSLKLHFYWLLNVFIHVWDYCNFSILWMRMRSCEYIESKSLYYLQNLKCREISKEIQFLTGPLYVVSLAQSVDFSTRQVRE